MLGRRELIFSLAALAAAPLPAFARATRPTVLAHGGGNISRQFSQDLMQAAGGSSRLLISGWGGNPVSLQADAEDVWRRLGWRNFDSLNAKRPGVARQSIRRADAVWFAGGIQRLHMDQIRGRVAADLVAAHGQGVVMAGAGAGAAMLSELMFQASRDQSMRMMKGLGVIPGAVIEPLGRDGLPRLRAAVRSLSDLVGIALDDNTWIVANGGGFQVRGRGSAHVVAVQDRSVTTTRLRSGAAYDIAARKVL